MVFDFFVLGYTSVKIGVLVIRNCSLLLPFLLRFLLSLLLLTLFLLVGELHHLHELSLRLLFQVRTDFELLLESLDYHIAWLGHDTDLLLEEVHLQWVEFARS